MFSLFRRYLVASVWIAAAFSTGSVGADDQKAETPHDGKLVVQHDRAALEKQFEQKLSGCALVGVFTVEGRQDADQPLRPERYEISKVTKIRDDYWLFQARVKYGEVDLTIPLTLKVLWAGDTPMISMTDLTIPALGTFTCRVMFYGDRYAGTWQHGKVGGHMWGTIEKLNMDKEPENSSN